MLQLLMFGFFKFSFYPPNGLEGPGFCTGTSTYTIDANDLAPGDTIICTATATDSSGITAQGSLDVPVQNPGPSNPFGG
jgi:hypothetical protein